MSLTIWIDADACPNMVKEVVYKAARRTESRVRLVANRYQRIPANPLFSLDVVDQSFDAADQFILERLSKADLVVTADVPFADEIIRKDCFALSPRGEEFNKKNIGDKLASRNLFSELRGGNLIQGGPPPLADRDKRQFADTFDRMLTKALAASRLK